MRKLVLLSTLLVSACNAPEPTDQEIWAQLEKNRLAQPVESQSAYTDPWLNSTSAEIRSDIAAFEKECKTDERACTKSANAEMALSDRCDNGDKSACIDPDPFISKMSTKELIDTINEFKAECPKPEEDVDCTYLVGYQDELKRRGVKF